MKLNKQWNSSCRRTKYHLTVNDSKILSYFWSMCKNNDKTCQKIMPELCMILGFCHKVAENCTVLGYYTASSGNFLKTTHCKITQKSAVLMSELHSFIKPSHCTSYIHESVVFYHSYVFGMPVPSSGSLYTKFKTCKIIISYVCNISYQQVYLKCRVVNVHHIMGKFKIVNAQQEN